MEAKEGWTYHSKGAFNVHALQSMHACNEAQTTKGTQPKRNEQDR